MGSPLERWGWVLGDTVVVGCFVIFGGLEISAQSVVWSGVDRVGLGWSFVVSAGGAGPGSGAVGLFVDGPAAVVLQIVVALAEAVEVVFAGVTALVPVAAVVQVAAHRGAGAVREGALPVPGPDEAG